MLVLRPVIGLLAVAFMLLLTPGVAAAQDAATTTTVTLPAVQPVHGQTATLTATVARTTMPGTDPTGMVQFVLDRVQLGAPVALTNRTAQIQTPPLTAGTHTVRAEYVPTLGGGFADSEVTANLTVAKAPTTTTVRIVPSNGIAGQDLDVEAVVTSTAPPIGTPTGFVSVVIDGASVGSDTLDGDGVARDTTGLGAAPHTISLIYQGDANHTGSGGSATVTIAKAGTVVVLTASPNPAAVGQLVSFTVGVDSLAPSLWWPSGLLTGTVDGVPVPGSVTIDGNGEGAGFGYSFASPGMHTATAHFTGDQDFLAANAALQMTVTGSSPYADPFPSTNVSRRSLAARGLTLKATPSRDRRAPYKFTVTGTVQLPSSVTKANGCSGRVTVEAKVKTKRVARKTATVTSACTYKTTFTSSRKGSVSVTAAFAGNASVAGVNAKAVKVKAG
jgi:hypothetical protein